MNILFIQFPSSSTILSPRLPTEQVYLNEICQSPSRRISSNQLSKINMRIRYTLMLKLDAFTDATKCKCAAEQYVNFYADSV